MRMIIKTRLVLLFIVNEMVSWGSPTLSSGWGGAAVAEYVSIVGLFFFLLLYSGNNCIV